MADTRTDTAPDPHREVLDLIQEIRDLIPHLARAADGRLIHTGAHAEQVDLLLVRLLGHAFTLTVIAASTGLPLQWVRTVRKTTRAQVGKRWQATRTDPRGDRQESNAGTSPLTPRDQLDAARELSYVCESIRQYSERRDRIIADLSDSGWSASAIEPHCDLGQRRIQVIAQRLRGSRPAADDVAPEETPSPAS